MNSLKESNIKSGKPGSATPSDPRVLDTLPEMVDKRTFFIVTDECYQNLVDTYYKSGFPCSAEEVAQMKKIMGPIADDCTEEDFRFNEDVKCDGCNRQINFFDMFVQGLDHHGTEFLKWAMFEKSKKVQMFPKDSTQVLVCSNCGQKITLINCFCYNMKSYSCYIRDPDRRV